MTKKSPEFFRSYIKVLSANVSYVQTSRALGMSEDLIFRWLASSKAAMGRGDSPSEFFFTLDPEDPDDAPRWLHEHVRSAISNSVQAIEAAARCRALNGVYTTAKFQGKTVWRDDPDLVELGFEGPDAWLRGPDGKPLPELVYTPPATDLVIAVLAAHSKIYRKNSTVDVNLSARLSGGVATVPMFPPAVAALPVLEIVQEADSRPDPATDDDFDEDMAATDTDPGSQEAATDLPSPKTASPEPVMIREPTPAQYAPPGNPLIQPRDSGRPLSPLERDLLSKIPGSLDRRA